MANVNLLPALAIAALCGVSLMYLGQWRAQRRLRCVMELEMSRIFEQIDLLRLDQLPTPADPSVAVNVPVTARLVAAPTARQKPISMSNGEAYAAALELAARGAGHSELSARCGLGRDEARILVAMRNAGVRPASAG